MNSSRRAILAQIADQLQEMLAELESLSSEEQESFDALPYALQQGPKGQAMESAVSDLEEAAAEIEIVLDLIGSAAS